MKPSVDNLKTSQHAPLRLVWNDEFEGDQLDYAKWECEVNAFGGGNNELQIYTDDPKNVRVESGCLILEAHREATGVAGCVREYSSGRIRSKRRGDWTYGFFEARIKLPSGRGLWPAFWMLPSDEVYGRWAASGEIDIMEQVGDRPHEVSAALHYGGVWPHNKFVTTPTRRLQGETFADDFHVFAVAWHFGHIRWFVDGIQVWMVERPVWREHAAGHDPTGPFDEKFHLLLNLAVGGNLPGRPDTSTPFPARMEVDWVRVWQ